MEYNINILPAIKESNEKSTKELSPQEFQQLLSSWFEDRGIIQDMKSYLKFQMINVLKNTVIGKNMKKTTPQSYSLAQQAIHLIVAEYLLHNQCHFTLSLFSTEVNLSNILPQQQLFNNSHIANEKINIFDKDNLVNILELLGISKDNDSFSKIINQYVDDPRKPLLNYLIDLIGKNGGDQFSFDENFKADADLEDDFMGNITSLLKSLKLSKKVYNILHHNIKLCYDLKTKSYENQCIKLITEFKKEIHVRDKTIYDTDKKRKSLEKKVLSLQEEIKHLSEKMYLLQKEQNEKDIPSTCSLNHCSEECFKINRLCETYKKEVDRLTLENNIQKEEILRLSHYVNELLKEFNCCQSKINLVNSKIQEDSINEFSSSTSKHKNINLEKITPESDSDMATEDVLQQAWLKLRLLEEESEELDIRYSNFVIK